MVWISDGVFSVNVFPQDNISDLSYISRYLIMRCNENVMIILCFFYLS